ncbi:MAG: winged helix DNA-binding protein [Thermus sp.]|uniref:MarR family winged helix-turn-helix transcriptional regulator n=1 Tax=unclassified Thermus TaxID=2619321 RepID=UPI000238922A|nr:MULTISPECIES: winged helix DNA-binding protein [unclassified Thermus]AEV16516.1 Transcriptional regulator MarR [Thermus sp. CCB_US3_UF1]MCS7217618.1 winged helix DNA-binding protein [Thermus sp.]MCX7849391.1 winged helix DNA-binding protein [Thermus sp.]MDW8017169.1 winged helix DNA-binding protein [Thermus sp.]MDW8357990.1 winged helix DNA-binding protein [Thermus sp.]
MNGPPAPLVEELSRLGYALMRLLLSQAKEVFAREGLSLQQAEVLRLVKEGVLLPSRLAEHLEVLPSQVSHLLASLEEAGLLERSPDLEDRRRVHLRLTPKGEAVQARMQAAWLQVFGQQLSRLNPEEVLLFRDLLRKLTEVGRG